MKKLSDYVKTAEASAGVTNQDAALRQASGQAFYNTSKFTLRDLRARANQQQLKADFEDYLDGFSSNVQDILENFEFRNQIPRLSNAWFDASSIKVGYEISFNRYFYKPQPLRSLEEIRNDILALEKETEGLLVEIVGGGS